MTPTEAIELINSGNVPDIMYVDSDLCLRLGYECRVRMIKLPDKMVVNGTLQINGLDIHNLPKYLKAKYLYVTDCPIISLPVNLNVKHSLYITRCLLEHYPRSIHVGLDVSLIGNPIKQLPCGLSIKGSLSIRDCPLEELPSDITVGKYITLRGTKIQRLPDSFVINDHLDISNSPIDSLPALIGRYTTVFVTSDSPLRLP